MIRSIILPWDRYVLLAEHTQGKINGGNVHDDFNAKGGKENCI